MLPYTLLHAIRFRGNNVCTQFVLLLDTEMWKMKAEIEDKKGNGKAATTIANLESVVQVLVGKPGEVHSGGFDSQLSQNCFGKSCQCHSSCLLFCSLKKTKTSFAKTFLN